jgi:hypothetical protein
MPTATYAGSISVCRPDSDTEIDARQVAPHQASAECAQFCVERKIDVVTHRWTLGQADEAYKLFDK